MLKVYESEADKRSTLVIVFKRCERTLIALNKLLCKYEVTREAEENSVLKALRTAENHAEARRMVREVLAKRDRETIRTVLSDIEQMRNTLRQDREIIQQSIRSLDQMKQELNTFQHEVMNQFSAVLVEAQASTTARDAGVWIEGERLGSTRCGYNCLSSEPKNNQDTDRMRLYSMPGSLWST